MAGVKPSMIRTIMNRATEIQNEGKPVIKFSVGEPDFDTPQYIKDAAITAMMKGQTKYTPAAGTMELRRAVSEKFLRENRFFIEFLLEIQAFLG